MATEYGLSANQDPPLTASWRRRNANWVYLFGGSAFALLMFVWFLPSLVAMTSMRQQISGWVIPDFEGEVKIGSASLGWLSSVVLRDVVLIDDQGETLGEIATLRTGKSLWSLMNSGGNVGKVELTGVHLHLVCTPAGSNVETAMGPLLAASDPHAAPVAATVVISDSQVEIARAGQAPLGAFNIIHLKLTTPAATAGPLQVELQGHAACGQRSGALNMNLAWQPPTAVGANPRGEGEVAISSDKVPMELFEPLLERVDPGLKFASRFSSNMKVSWSQLQNQPVTSFSGSADLNELFLQAPTLIGADTLGANQFRLAGQATLYEDRLEMTGCEFTSELGNLKANGALPIKLLDQEQLATWVAHLHSTNFKLDGEINLAQLALLFPNTLKIRPGTEITSGTLAIGIAGSTTNSSRHWNASVVSRSLSARNGQQVLTWNQPIELTAVAEMSSAGLKIHQFSCKSSFLQVQAQGSPESARLIADADLDKLAAELGQFFDLSALQLAGKAHADMTLARQTGGVVNAQGTLTVAGWEVTLPSARPWREDYLAAALTARGQVGAEGLRSLDQALLQLTSGGDRLEVELRQAVAAARPDAVWPVRFTVEGQLGSWVDRAQPLVSLPGWWMRGSGQLSGNAVLGAGGANIEQAKGEFRNLDIRSQQLFINEPLVTIDMVGVWDSQAGRLQSPSLSVASGALAFRALNLDLKTSPVGLEYVAGTVDFRSDLARLQAWGFAPDAPPEYRWSGQAVGQLVFNHNAGSTAGRWEVDVADLAVARYLPPLTGIAGAQQISLNRQAGQLQSVWSERQVKLTGEANYTSANDLLQINQSQITAALIQIRTAGAIQSPGTLPVVNLNGQIDYDLEQISQQLRGYLGPNITFAGRKTENFSLQGPLSEPGPNVVVGSASPNPPQVSANLVPNQLAGQAGLAWDGANVGGLMVGPGRLDGRLVQGIIEFAPFQFTMSEGRVGATPVVRLNGGPPLLTVSAGRVAENIRFSPEMCRTWLKYVAPLIADSTQIDGRFSLQLAENQVPLLAPERTTAAGVLEIHSAQVAPGPFVNNMLGLARQVKAVVKRAANLGQPGAVNGSLLTISQQNVRFQMVDGRVHHEGLQFNMGDIIVRTSGSVGMDQTMVMVAEVPIMPDWIAGNRLLAGLQGQVIRLPISGTFAQPRVDQGAVTQLTQQLLNNAAGRVIEDQLKNGLNRLFNP